MIRVRQSRRGNGFGKLINLVGLRIKISSQGWKGKSLTGRPTLDSPACVSFNCWVRLFIFSHPCAWVESFREAGPSVCYACRWCFFRCSFVEKRVFFPSESFHCRKDLFLTKCEGCILPNSLRSSFTLQMTEKSSLHFH